MIPNSPRRWLLAYLAAIAVPTLVLLYLQFESMRRQRLTMEALTVSNLALSGERLAAEIERSTTRAVEATLHDGELSRILELLTRISGPTESRAVRLTFESLRMRHASSDQFFLMQGNTLRYPRMRTLAELPDNQSPCLQAAKAEESKGQTRLALAAYQNCLDVARSDSSRAVALSAAARCLRKLGQINDAAETYAGLGERYGDVYDALGRPYGLSATIESGRKDLMQKAWNEFVSGRWELSAEQVEWYQEKFHEQFGRTPNNDAPFLRRFAIARALEREFRTYAELHLGEVYPLAIPRDPACQLFYIPLSAQPGAETILFVSIKPDWLEETLPGAKSRSGTNADAKLVPSGTSEPGRTTVRFRMLFPFRELSMAPANDIFRARPGTYLFAAITALVLLSLLAGILLLLRDHWRQWELNRLRASFVSSVSHELKTPLSGIRLYSDMLLQKPHFTESERRGFCERIGGEAERLTHLVEGILEFSRIDRGQRSYSLTESDLAVTIARVVDAQTLHWQARGFTIHADFARDLPSVPHDAEAVHGAVFNLLDNAVKYSGDSRLIETRLHRRDGSVVFEAQDHGIGIPVSERDRIFEQFYRGSNVAATGGSGLGLYLVRHVMEGHRGSVEVKSEPDGGTTFSLVFVAS